MASFFLHILKSVSRQLICLVQQTIHVFACLADHAHMFSNLIFSDIFTFLLETEVLKLFNFYQILVMLGDNTIFRRGDQISRTFLSSCLKVILWSNFVCMIAFVLEALQRPYLQKKTYKKNNMVHILIFGAGAGKVKFFFIKILYLLLLESRCIYRYNSYLRSKFLTSCNLFGSWHKI